MRQQLNKKYEKMVSDLKDVEINNEMDLNLKSF
jgi:hypothetical protein